MKKNQIATAPIIDAHNENSTGLVLKELIGKSTVGSHRGLLALATFSVNGSQNLYRLANANHVAYLLSGEADYLTETGPVALGPGDTVYAPKGDWHGFRNKGSQEAVFIFMYSPVSDYGALSYEAYQGIYLKRLPKSRPSDAHAFLRCKATPHSMRTPVSLALACTG